VRAALIISMDEIHRYCHSQKRRQAMLGGTGSVPYLVLRVRRGPHLLRVSVLMRGPVLCCAALCWC